MNLKEQLSLITKVKKRCDSIIKEINATLFEEAEFTDLACKVYQLEAKNEDHQGTQDKHIETYVKVKNLTQQDQYIINYYRDQGLHVTFSSVNLNPHPEVGEEGYQAAYYMNLSWK